MQLHIIKDGQKGDVLNLSNARRKTYAQLQQMTDAQKKGVIVCEDYPVEDFEPIPSEMVTYGEGTVDDALDEVNNPTFTEAETRTNIVSGESLSTIFGKIKKWFSDVAVKNAANRFSTSQYFDAKNGTASSVAATNLYIGNNIPAGTEGNSRGQVILFGEGSAYTALYAPNSTQNRAIDLPDKSGTLALTSDVPVVTELTQSVTVTANSVNGTALNFGSIPTSKILMVQVTWSNSVNDVPVSLVCYSNNATYVNRVVHTWSVAQTVNFRILVLHYPY